MHPKICSMELSFRVRKMIVQFIEFRSTTWGQKLCAFSLIIVSWTGVFGHACTHSRLTKRTHKRATRQAKTNEHAHFRFGRDGRLENRYVGRENVEALYRYGSMSVIMLILIDTTGRRQCRYHSVCELTSSSMASRTKTIRSDAVARNVDYSV